MPFLRLRQGIPPSLDSHGNKPIPESWGIQKDKKGTKPIYGFIPFAGEHLYQLSLPGSHLVTT
jgi:hypothetical protein